MELVRQAILALAALGILAAGAKPAPAGTDTTQPTAGGSKANTSPTIDEVQQALDKRDFAAVIKLSSRLLALRGTAGEGLNRYQLLGLKGEGLLGSHSLVAAAVCYDQAAKETIDPHEIALAKCTAMLFRRAHSTTYVPRVAPIGADKPGPIDLLDRDKRQAAFGALLDDELAAIQPRIKAASTSPSLVQIFPVLQQVQDLQALDLVANGDDSKTLALAGGLIEHSRVLTTVALKGMWQRVDDIDKFANQSTTIQSSAIGGDGSVTNIMTTRKTGLSPSHKGELNDVITTCGKIHSAGEAFMASTKDDKDWAAIMSDASRIAGRAKDVLNANYSDVTSTTGTPGSGSGPPPALPPGLVPRTPAVPARSR